MSEEILKEANKMIAFEKLAKIMITTGNEVQVSFWTRVQKEIYLVTEGLANDEQDQKINNL